MLRKTFYGHKKHVFGQSYDASSKLWFKSRSSSFSHDSLQCLTASAIFNLSFLLSIRYFVCYSLLFIVIILIFVSAILYFLFWQYCNDVKTVKVGAYCNICILLLQNKIQIKSDKKSRKKNLTYSYEWPRGRSWLWHSIRQRCLIFMIPCWGNIGLITRSPRRLKYSTVRVRHYVTVPHLSKVI